MRLNESERQARLELIQDGWTVYRNGWPDFLVEKNGTFRFIEVKTGKLGLSKGQREMAVALAKLTNLSVEVKNYKSSGLKKKRTPYWDNPDIY